MCKGRRDRVGSISIRTSVCSLAQHIPASYKWINLDELFPHLETLVVRPLPQLETKIDCGLVGVCKLVSALHRWESLTHPPHSCSPLQLLDIAGNQLTEIPEGLPPSLEYLYLQNNKISSVPANAFDSTPNLKGIFLR